MSSSISHVTSSGSVSTAMPSGSNVNNQVSSVVSGSANHQVISSSSVTMNNSQSNSAMINQSTVNSQVASSIVSLGVVSSNGTISGFNGSLSSSVSNDHDN